MNIFFALPEGKSIRNLKEYADHLTSCDTECFNNKVTFSGQFNYTLTLLEDVFSINKNDSKKLLESFLFLFFERTIISNHGSTEKKIFQLSLNRTQAQRYSYLNNFLLILESIPNNKLKSKEKLQLFLASIFKYLNIKNNLKKSYLEKASFSDDWNIYKNALKNYLSFTLTNHPLEKKLKVKTSFTYHSIQEIKNFFIAKYGEEIIESHYSIKKSKKEIIENLCSFLLKNYSTSEDSSMEEKLLKNILLTHIKEFYL